MIPLGSIWAAIKGATALWGPIMDALASLSDLTLQQAITLSVIAVAVWSLGLGFGTLQQDDPTPPVDTLYADRPLAEDDTADAPEPTTRTLYKTVTDTVAKPCLVPRNVSPADYSLVTDRPLTFGGGNATVTRYDIGDQRYVQDVYALPFDRHHVGIGAAAVATPSVQLGMTTLSYRRRWDTPIGVLSAGSDAGVAWSPQHGREPAISLTASIRF